MKEIISPKRKDYFRFEGSWLSKSALIHYETQNFNVLTIIILANFIIFVVGFFKPQLFTIPLTTLILVLFNYFKLRHIAKFLEVSRKCEKKGKENEKTSVIYEFKNYSLFKITNLTLLEKFDGTSLKYLSSYLDLNLKTKRKKKLRKHYPLNEGFGEKYFEELTLILSDTLGMFSFKVIYDFKDEILVYPEIQNVRSHSLTNNDDSYLSGDYEVFKKGISPNFYSIKQYQYGDPVKNINWKISQKLNELVVNEYENAVNLKVHYILNFNEDSHLGRGVNSTWEYTRDTALALLQNEVAKSHYYDVYSNSFNTNLSSGRSHFEMIELKMCFIKPCYDERSLVKNFIDEKYKGHAIVYITPYVMSQSVLQDIELLKRHMHIFSDVHLYLVDPFDSAYRLIMPDYKVDLLRLKDQSHKSLDHHLSQLQSLGAKINHIKIKSSHKIQRQMKIWENNYES